MILIRRLSWWGHVFIGEPVGLPSEKSPGVEDQFINGFRPLTASFCQRFGGYRTPQITGNEIYQHG